MSFGPETVDWQKLFKSGVLAGTAPTTGVRTAPVIGADYQAQLEAEALKAKMAALEYEGSQKKLTGEAGQMVGKWYVPKSPLAMAAEAFGVYQGRKGMEESLGRQADIRRKYEADALADRTKILDMTQPQAKTDYSNVGPTTGLDGPDFNPQKVSTPPDLRAAEQAALKSQFPQTRELAKVLAEQREKALTLGAPHASPESAILAAQTGDPNKLSPLSAQAPAERKDSMGNTYQIITDPKTGKQTVTYAPKETKVSTTVSTGDKFGLAGFNNRSDITFKEMRPEAEAAAKNLQTTAAALSALPRSQTGILIPASQAIQQVGKAFGIDTATTAGTAELSSLLKQRIMAKLGGKLGAQISDADRKFVEGYAGDLASDKDALYRLLSLDMATSMQSIERYNQQLSGLAAEENARDPNSQANYDPYRVNFKVGGIAPEVDAMIGKALQGQPIGAMPAPPEQGGTGATSAVQVPKAPTVRRRNW